MLFHNRMKFCKIYTRGWVELESPSLLHNQCRVKFCYGSKVGNVHGCCLWMLSCWGIRSLFKNAMFIWPWNVRKVYFSYGHRYVSYFWLQLLKYSLSFYYLHASFYNRNKMLLGFAKLWITSPIWKNICLSNTFC